MKDFQMQLIGIFDKQFELAYSIAREQHDGQFRKSKTEQIPYIEHPIFICSCLRGELGILDSDILSAAMLHDVLEDGKDKEVLASYLRLAVSPDCFHIVSLLTKQDGYVEEYYEKIKTSRAAVIVKLADRLHNVRTMGDGFSPKKIQSYIEETKTHVLPLAEVFKSDQTVSRLKKMIIETIETY